MSQPTPKLLPCPFCNGKAECMMTHLNHFIVHCVGCGVEQGEPSINDAGAAAIEVWNHRSPSPVNAALRDALEKTENRSGILCAAMKTHNAVADLEERIDAEFLGMVENIREAARTALAAAKLPEQ